MHIETTPLAGVVVIRPEAFADERGYFLETYQAARYHRAGITANFVQDNSSRSMQNVLRGLHAQPGKPQGKLIRVSQGAVWDVAVDPNPASPTYRQHFGLELSDKNHLQLYIPPGYLHGFLTLSEEADLSYKCTDYYAPDDEAAVHWDDPQLAIDWPMRGQPIVSHADEANGSLADYVHAHFDARVAAHSTNDRNPDR